MLLETCLKWAQIHQSLPLAEVTPCPPGTGRHTPAGRKLDMKPAHISSRKVQRRLYLPRHLSLGAWSCNTDLYGDPLFKAELFLASCRNLCYSRQLFTHLWESTGWFRALDKRACLAYKTCPHPGTAGAVSSHSTVPPQKHGDSAPPGLPAGSPRIRDAGGAFACAHITTYAGPSVDGAGGTGCCLNNGKAPGADPARLAPLPCGKWGTGRWGARSLQGRAHAWQRPKVTLRAGAAPKRTAGQGQRAGNGSNHGIPRVGRDLKDHLIPTPLPRAGTPSPRAGSRLPFPRCPCPRAAPAHPGGIGGTPVERGSGGEGKGGGGEAAPGVPRPAPPALAARHSQSPPPRAQPGPPAQPRRHRAAATRPARPLAAPGHAPRSHWLRRRHPRHAPAARSGVTSGGGALPGRGRAPAAPARPDSAAREDRDGPAPPPPVRLWLPRVGTLRSCRGWRDKTEDNVGCSSGRGRKETNLRRKRSGKGNRDSDSIFHQSKLGLSI